MRTAWLERLWEDVQQTLRAARKAPAFTLGAVLTLALGIGANSALFTVLDAVLLRPLPYAQPAQLVTWEGNHSALDIEDFGARVPALASVGLFGEWPLDLAEGALPERVDGALVTGGLFPTLGVPAALGRTIVPADDREGAPPVVVLGHALWRNRFAAAPDILGRTLSLAGQPYTVVGVLPERFRLPQGEAEAFVPARVAYAEGLAARGAHFLYPVARLRAGASLAQAQAAVDGVARQLRETHPEETKEMTYVLQGLHERVVGPVRPALLVLLGAVGLVLLVACSTFANLLLARASGRHRELAVRSALGASRGRLVALLLSESVVLALAGAAAGLVLSLWVVDALQALAPEDIPGLAEARVGGVTLGFTAGMALLTGLLAGLVPALQASRPALRATLAEGGPTQAGGRGAARARQVLVGAQLALALMLLVGTGLLLRSLWRLQSVDLGFEPAGALSLRLDLPPTRYATQADQNPFLRGLLERARALPGVDSAGLVSELPLSGARLEHNIVVEGLPPVPPGEEPSAQARTVSEGYLETVRIPLLRGRTLRAGDDASAQRVAVVTRAFVQQFLRGQEPLGRRVRWARGDADAWMTIVGVVGDIRHQSPDKVEGAALYVPFAQNEAPWKRWTHLVVRAPGGAAALAALAPALQQQAAALDPLLPLTEPRTLEQVLGAALEDRRFQLALLGAFATLALVLAGLGVYGVTAFLVTQRTREFGIRLALGARGGAVLGLVMRQTLATVAAGCALGLLGSAALAGGLRAFLFGVQPLDPLTFGLLTLGLAAVALAASLLPAWRATRVDPALALRAQ
ncbi:MAG TPA: ABC transporter permease [Aggregicoccus sp.]|nr:ABC transporter permease [Aggregicoccus sp.]